MAWVRKKLLNLKARNHTRKGRKIFSETNPQFKSPCVTEPGQHPKTRVAMTNYIYSIGFRKKSSRLIGALKALEITFENTQCQVIDAHVAELAKQIGSEKARAQTIQELERALKNLKKSLASFDLITIRAEKLEKKSPQKAKQLKIIRSGLSNTQMGIENYIQLAFDHLTARY